MHRAWPLFLLILGAAGTAVAQPQAKPRAPISGRLAQEIRRTLPDYDPAADRAERPARLEVPRGDPNVITLPEMVVEDRKVAVRALEERDREEQEFGRLKRKYLASMSAIGNVLNSWTIPLVSGGDIDAMAAAEARREMERERFDRFEAVADAAADPASGESLRREIRAVKHGTRPAGWPSLRP